MVRNNTCGCLSTTIFTGLKKKETFLIARRLDCSLADVIIRYFLKYTQINAIILGMTPHFQKNPLDEISAFYLTETEEKALKTHFNFILPGDVYDLERYSEKHATIMKYNLNDAH